MSDFFSSPRHPVSQAELQQQVPQFREYLLDRMSQLVVAAVEGSSNVELAIGGKLLCEFNGMPDEFDGTNLHDPVAIKDAILNDDWGYAVDVARGEGSRLRLNTKNNVTARAYRPSFEQLRLEREAERQQTEETDSLAPPPRRDDLLIRSMYDSTPVQSEMLRYLPTFAEGNLLYSFSTERDDVYEMREKGIIHIHTGDDHSVEDDLALHQGWNNDISDKDGYFPLLNEDLSLEDWPPGTYFTYYAKPQAPHPNPMYEAMYQQYGSPSVAMAYMRDVALTLENLRV